MPESTPPDFSQPKMTRKETAAYSGVAEKTLADWACSRRSGPPFYRLGKKVVYLKADVDAWLASRRVVCGSNP